VCSPLVEFDLWEYHVALRPYSTAMVTAVVVIVVLGTLIAVRRGLPGRLSLFCLLTMAAAGAVGARLLWWATHTATGSHTAAPLLRLHFSGFSFGGGLVLAVLAGLLVCRLGRMNAWRLADSAAPALALGFAVMRLGCFFNGCCFGRETALPWGVTYPVGSPAHLHQLAHRLDILFLGPQPVHPTQLYEAAAALVAAALAGWLLLRKAPDGTAVLAAGLWLVASRWGNSYLRAAVEPSSFPAWVEPVCLMVLLLLGMATVLRRRKQASGLL